MTDIEKKSLALVNEIRAEYGYTVPITYDWFNADSFEHLAFLRAIEQHEAYKQWVSDGVVKATHAMAAGKLVEASGILAAFIIAKPDPLVEALKQLKMSYVDAEDFRAALAARGLEIREKQP